LLFRPAAWLDEAQYDIVKKQGVTDDAKRAIKMSFSTASSEAKVALPAPAIEGTPPTRKPKVEAVAADDDEEPKVRKEAAPAQNVKAKGNLDALVDEWDDE
jgi:hypothetical protein